MSDKTEWTAGKIIGLITACLVLAGLVLWGVPHYIAGQVRAQVTTELEALPADPHPVSAGDFATVVEKVGTTEATVLRMEAAMIERDKIILKYFQDKAGDADDSG